MAVTAAVDAIRARYDRRRKPYAETQKRNAGVVLPQLQELEKAEAAEIDALIRHHERARDLERAARAEPMRAVTTAERQQEQRALAEFGADLPGGSRRHQLYDTASRATHDIWSW